MARPKGLRYERPEVRADVIEASERISIQSLSGHELVPSVTIESLQLGSLARPRVKAAVFTNGALKPKEEGSS